ncbi:MAG: hypothetical protein WBP93_10385 [Pyrinomonadaceae bacterium]
MQLARKASLLTIVFASALLLTACPSKTTISQINADPGRYRNKDVGIVGVVTDSYGALGNGVYEIDDGTGKMWVVTRRGVPARGSRVGTAGRITTGFSYGGRTYGTVLMESDRRYKGR